MKLKTNVVVGLIFLALLAFVYFYEIKGGEERKAAADRAKELLSFKQSEAQKLVIERRDTTIVLENRDGDWVLTAPVADAADQEAVERYLRNLQESERERVIVDSADAVGDAEVAAEYQLGEPRLKVRLETEDEDFGDLSFGADSPTETYVYVQQGGVNPEIFTVRAWRFDNLDKSVFELRDTRVLLFDKEEVEEIRLLRPDGQIVAIKGEEGNWRLREPVDALAEESAVDGLLNQLRDAKVEAFVDEAPDDEALGGYGLAPVASLEVSLIVGEDRAEKRLHIGEEAEGGKYLARDLSSPQVFLVDTTLVYQLRKEVTELRDKKPLKFERDQVSRIELLNAADEKIVAEKDTAGAWSLASPASLQAKSWKLNSLLTDLEQLEVAGFVDEGDRNFQAAKEKVLLLFDLHGDGKKLLQARFVSNADGDIYLTRDGDASVYRIEEEDFVDLDLRLDDVAQAPPKEEPAEATEVGE